MPSAKIAFVLGNGISRRGLDLEAISRLGPVYGCNALYREFAPELLVATDTPIAREIEQTGYAKTHRFVTRYPVLGTGSEKIQMNFNWSSGPIAISYACAESATAVYLLGFDLCGLAGKFNNVYADTEFYKKSTDTETYSGNWISQISSVISSYHYIRFTRVLANSATPQSEFQKFKNFNEIEVRDFLTCINTITK
jgi:hypothetical protein